MVSPGCAAASAAVIVGKSPDVETRSTRGDGVAPCVVVSSGFDPPVHHQPSAMNANTPRNAATAQGQDRETASGVAAGSDRVDAGADRPTSGAIPLPFPLTKAAPAATTA